MQARCRFWWPRLLNLQLAHHPEAVIVLKSSEPDADAAEAAVPAGSL